MMCSTCGKIGWIHNGVCWNCGKHYPRMTFMLATDLNRANIGKRERKISMKDEDLTAPCEFDEAFRRIDIKEETGWCYKCRLDCPLAEKRNTDLNGAKGDMHELR